MTLTLNPYFSQWSFAAQPEGYPDVITYHVARSEEQALADVLAGRAHGSWTYNPLPATVTSRPGYIQRYELMDVQMLYVNSTLPPFNDLRVRQALNYALDRPRVLNTMHGPGGVVGLLTCQLLPPSIPGYRPYCPDQTGPADKPYQGRDLVKGRELAAASGTLGVPITVHQSTRFPFLVNLGEEAASTLRELGYHVEVEQIPPEHRSNNPEDPAYGIFQIFSQVGGATMRRRPTSTTTWSAAGVTTSPTTATAQSTSRRRQPKRCERPIPAARSRRGPRWTTC